MIELLQFKIALDRLISVLLFTHYHVKVLFGNTACHFIFTLRLFLNLLCLELHVSQAHDLHLIPYDQELAYLVPHVPLYRVLDSYLLLSHFNVEWDRLAVLVEHVSCVSSLGFIVSVVEGVDYFVDVRGVLGADELGGSHGFEEGAARRG